MGREPPNSRPLPLRIMVLATLVLAACGSPDPSPAKAGGIRGVVRMALRAGPIGVTPWDPTFAPEPATIRISEMESGRRIRTIRTTADGWFRVSVPAGTYRLDIEPDDCFSIPMNARISGIFVSSGSLTRADARLLCEEP